jgi:hypothetical protein
VTFGYNARLLNSTYVAFLLSHFVRSANRPQESSCPSQGVLGLMSRFFFIVVLLIFPATAFFPRFVRPYRVVKLATTSDVNAITDAKRRLADVQMKIAANLDPSIINYVKLVERISDLEQQSSDVRFWEDQVVAKTTMAEVNNLKTTVSRVQQWRKAVDDVQLLLQMALEQTEGGKFQRGILAFIQ